MGANLSYNCKKKYWVICNLWWKSS